MLLDGFLEFWYSWKKQISALAESGCRVIVPDQRGYNLSDKPQGVKAYCVDTLVGDIVGLINALDYCDEGNLIFFPDAPHWVQHEEADEVNRQLLTFISS